jgi:FkbM family methyltransferase
MSITTSLKFIASHPLTKNNKFKSLVRLLKWQIGSRITPYPIVYPFVSNTCLVVERGMTGATGNIYAGLHEFSDMGFLLHFLREQDLFVDIGANIGSYTVLASGVKKASTIAIEPSTNTFKRLIRNIQINEIGKLVKPMNIGLGSEATTKFFTKSLDTINHIVESNNVSKSNVEEIQIEKLDNVIKHNESTILLKIDVEGFETEVLKGANLTLSNNNLKAIIIELNGSGDRYGFNEEHIHDNFIINGFKPYLYNPLNRELTEIKTFGSHNTIYIRDIEFVQERISSSPKVKVLDYTF